MHVARECVRTHARCTPKIMAAAQPTSRSRRVGMSHASRMSLASPVMSANPVPARRSTRAPRPHALLPPLLLLLATAAAAAEAVLHWLPLVDATPLHLAAGADCSASSRAHCAMRCISPTPYTLASVWLFKAATFEMHDVSLSAHALQFHSVSFLHK